jgi:hypothetical protein
VTHGDIEVLWLGPDEWLVVAPPGQQARLDTQLRNAATDGWCAITDVSAQRTALTIAGEAAVDALALGLFDRSATIGQLFRRVLPNAARTGWRDPCRSQTSRGVPHSRTPLVRSPFGKLAGRRLDGLLSKLDLRQSLMRPSSVFRAPQ